MDLSKKDTSMEEILKLQEILIKTMTQHWSFHYFILEIANLANRKGVEDVLCDLGENTDICMQNLGDMKEINVFSGMYVYNTFELMNEKNKIKTFVRYE